MFLQLVIARECDMIIGKTHVPPAERKRFQAVIFKYHRSRYNGMINYS